MGDLELNKNIFLKTGQIYKDLLQPSNHGQIILGQCKTCKEGQKEELEPIVATEKMGLVAKFFQCANCLKGNQQLANVVKQFYGKEDDNQMTGKKWEVKKKNKYPFSANYHYSETDDYKALSPKYVTIFSQCKYCRERQGRYCESGAEYCRKKVKVEIFSHLNNRIIGSKTRHPIFALGYLHFMRICQQNDPIKVLGCIFVVWEQGW